MSVLAPSPTFGAKCPFLYDMNGMEENKSVPGGWPVQKHADSVAVFTVRQNTSLYVRQPLQVGQDRVETTRARGLSRSFGGFRKELLTLMMSTLFGKGAQRGTLTCFGCAHPFAANGSRPSFGGQNCCGRSRRKELACFVIEF